jgi:hypothetical protein
MSPNDDGGNSESEDKLFHQIPRQKAAAVSDNFNIVVTASVVRNIHESLH